MTVALYTHPICLKHAPGPGHPESPARLTAILNALDQPIFSQLTRLEAPLATREQLRRVHQPTLIETILDDSATDTNRQLDADTQMSPDSAQAALRAAGAMCAATDAVMEGQIQRAFCAVRPPGHHATAQSAMGFCLFNNIAVGAAHALTRFNLKRLAIVDFDVHHGNGTQDIFYSDTRVLYASTHQSPLYPGTGSIHERGNGNIVNAPLPAGSGSLEFRAAFNDMIFPAITRHRPELILISAGFDAHRLDPLASLMLETDDYGWVTKQLVALAEHYAQGRIISTLEGGYSLIALEQSVTAHVLALL